MRFWISWEERAADYRPINDPPNEAVLGWWCSGEAGDGSFHNLCAVVDAADEDQARAAVLKDWPSSTPVVWRFVNRVEADYVPGDRFPVQPNSWSSKRFAKRS